MSCSSCCHILTRDRQTEAHAVQALPDEGCLVACERDEECMQLARRFWAAADVSHKASSRLAVLSDTK